MKKSNLLPKLLQSTLWSYDLKRLSVEKDKNLIIEQILNYGSWEQLKWLWRNYSSEEIKNVFKNPSRGLWREDVLNYWLKIFDLNLPNGQIKKSLFSLEVK